LERSGAVLTVRERRIVRIRGSPSRSAGHILRVIERRHRRRYGVALFVLLVAFSCPSASAWDFITKSDDGLMNFYGDPKSMVHRGDTLRIRLLFDYRELQQDPDTLIEHRSTIELASVECRDRRIAAVQATSYSRNMGRGRAVVANERVPEERLRYVAAKPASVDDKVVSFACARRRGANHERERKRLPRASL
jgi:hypothetical protein